MHKGHMGYLTALRRQPGFTLIELMIVVAIISVLAGIGYPSYIQYVTKAKRSAAQGFMLQIASREEQYLADARTYTGAFTTSGDPLYMTPPAETTGKYNVVVTVVTATTDAGYIAGVALPQYTITATPIGNQAANDTKCGTLTLNSVGTKGKSGTGSVTDCWS